MFNIDCKDLLVGALFVVLCFVVLAAALYGLLLVLVVGLVVIIGLLFSASLITGSTMSVWK